MRLAIAAAASAADAGRLDQLVRWLADIQRIAREAAAADPPAADAAKPLTAPAAAQSTVRGAAEQAPKARETKRYPRFFRQGESLVKVGWSKKSREEYEHKAPKTAVFAVASALHRAGGAGRRITMDNVIPVHDETLNSSVPDYQVYVALAWLRDLRLVVQHGRQGYTLAANGNLQQSVGTSWDALAVR